MPELFFKRNTKMARAAKLPGRSVLYRYIGEKDFVDCFAAPIQHQGQTIDDLARGAKLKMPKWAIPLLVLRNILVTPFGLRTTHEGQQSEAGELVPGELIGFFRIYERHDDEVIMGDDDKHLDYRVSVFREPGAPETLYAATWVKRNNWLGHLYLFLVLPFHKLIVKNMVKQIAQQKPPQP
jgi:hypothetical protein